MEVPVWNTVIRIRDYVVFGIMSYLGLCRIWDYVVFGIMLQSGLCRIRDNVAFGIMLFGIMLHSGYIIRDYVAFGIMSHSLRYSVVRDWVDRVNVARVNVVQDYVVRYTVLSVYRKAFRFFAFSLKLEPDHRNRLRPKCTHFSGSGPRLHGL